MSQELTRKALEKVWGQSDLEAPFAIDQSKKIGEIWFEPEPSFDRLLVKYLFTSEKLSVQVHPSDRQAERMGIGDQGKEECWLIIDAEPGAAVALGLDGQYEAEAVRRGALEGTIEDMLVWHEVKAGDFFHVLPGTIHAIGAGLRLLEIQQNTDVTFRLYDYGRPRDLHLEEAMQCARFGEYPTTCRKRVEEVANKLLLDRAPFSVAMFNDQHLIEAHESALVIPISGILDVNSVPLEEGSCHLMEVGDTLHSLIDAKFVMVHDKQRERT